MATQGSSDAQSPPKSVEEVAEGLNVALEHIESLRGNPDVQRSLDGLLGFVKINHNTYVDPTPWTLACGRLIFGDDAVCMGAFIYIRNWATGHVDASDDIIESAREVEKILSTSDSMSEKWRVYCVLVYLHLQSNPNLKRDKFPFENLWSLLKGLCKGGEIISFNIEGLMSTPNEVQDGDLLSAAQKHGGNYEALRLLWSDPHLQVKVEGLMESMGWTESRFGHVVPWDKAYESYYQGSDEEGRVRAILTFVEFAEQVVKDADITWKETELKETQDEKWETFKIAANLWFEIKRKLLMKKELQEQMDDQAIHFCPQPRRVGDIFGRE